MTDVEAPEGYYFKGYYMPGFGVVTMYLIHKRKYWFDKKEAFAMTLLEHHATDMDAISFLKKQALVRWKIKNEFVIK